MVVDFEQTVPLDEQLARFVTNGDWVRNDGTLKHHAFMPPPDLHFSVTRHDGLSIDELWEIGAGIVAQVGLKRSAELIGRADVKHAQFNTLKLRAVSAPISGNRNHVHIIDWPAEKAAQKSIAQELAIIAQYTARYI